MLRSQGGRTVTRLARAGRLAIDVIGPTNHTFTSVWSQGALAASLAA